MTQEEARAELARRLREGDYIQGEGALKVVHPDTQEAHHCCLGVGGEIAVEEGLCEWVPYKGPAPEGSPLAAIVDAGYEIMALRPISDYDGRYEVMPYVVRDFFGFKGQDGRYGIGAGASLTSNNDNGISFAEISEKVVNEPGLLA